MGWDKGGLYYTRSRRENGRVVREYVGGGLAGQLAAQLDADERAVRLAEQVADRAEREEVSTLDAPLAELDLLAEAALLSAGYHRHNRGDWRRRRVHHNDIAEGG
ncbi:MAG TPA: hypothetical protein VM533_05535 [Fimbriiglobus sp.]|nr:hypothetical protein [Fimbriiglobus sp.]